MKNLLLRIFFPDLFVRRDLREQPKSSAELEKERAECAATVARHRFQQLYFEKQRRALDKIPDEKLMPSPDEQRPESASGGDASAKDEPLYNF